MDRFKKRPSEKSEIRIDLDSWAEKIFIPVEETVHDDHWRTVATVTQGVNC